jgi:hypothetical protein
MFIYNSLNDIGLLKFTLFGLNHYEFIKTTHLIIVTRLSFTTILYCASI